MKEYNEVEKTLKRAIQLMSNVNRGHLRSNLQNRLNEQELLVDTLDGLNSVYFTIIKEKRNIMAAMFDRVDYLEDQDHDKGQEKLEEYKPEIEKLTHEIGALHSAMDEVDKESIEQKRIAIEIAVILDMFK